MKKAICLVSGGMDSGVTAAVSKSLGYGIYVLHVSYGQRTEQKELRCAKRVAGFYNARDFKHVGIDYLRDIGGSALTDEDMEVPGADLDSDEIPVTYVPFRNANLLSIAVSWAEVIGADAIFIGAHCEDFAGYPDCRPEFYDAFNRLIETGTKEKGIKVETPLMFMNKTEIVEKGIALGAPFELTWSCYKREDVPCGECDSCVRRASAFKDAGYEDPLLF
ncbi:MAG: 7-cyano-7-deazaguanine synthase QueC [Candidatus Altiarchaeales archaeon WOR_SM1_86-2]|nr:MAG: 7-cyano-7-deazaguanine synthase QueC [Candidatus Altiarchaeales archaeon WOR_SM1_86-2]